MSAIESSKPVESLRKQLEEATVLCSRALIPQDAYRRWRCTTEELIIRAFGPESRSVAAFRRDGELLVGSAAWEMNEGLLAVQRRRDLADEIAVLMGCIAQLDSSSVDGRRTQPGEDDRRSILVHGREGARREAVAEFLGRLGLSASFCQGVPESSREAEYVVILTDDGRATGDEGTRPGASRSYVFELGFFLGRVGRDRVCALHGSGVEIPSDVSGVLSVEFDPRGSWQLELARDLRKAGFAVDLNRLLECPGGDPPHARR